MSQILLAGGNTFAAAIPVGSGFLLRHWSCWGSVAGMKSAQLFAVLFADQLQQREVGRIALPMVGTPADNFAFAQAVPSIQIVPELQSPGGFGSYWNLQLETDPPLGYPLGTGVQNTSVVPVPRPSVGDYIDVAVNVDLTSTWPTGQLVQILGGTYRLVQFLGGGQQLTMQCLTQGTGDIVYGTMMYPVTGELGEGGGPGGGYASCSVRAIYEPNL